MFVTLSFFSFALVSSCAAKSPTIEPSEPRGPLPSALGKAPLIQTLDQGESHPCDRECLVGRKPLVCEYKFKLELTNTLSKACFNCPLNITDCYRPHCNAADGVERGLITVNRQLPGPPVAVCQGDMIVVDVVNDLDTESSSMHWHGEHQRDGFQFMDGVPYVTQCPIHPKSRFRYTFKAATPGTLFYHSHSAYQRADGAFGPLIIRQDVETDPHFDLYDFDLTEHVISVQEFFHTSAREAFVLHHWDTGKNKADNILINGRGRFRKFNPKYNNANDEIKGVDMMTATPNEVFYVEQDQRYRFRVISPGFTLCPILVSVDDHDLTVIASDGQAFEPRTVSSFVIHDGERYDFVLHANQTSGTYLMRFGGLFDCAPTKAHGVALLHYKEAGEVQQLTKDTLYEEAVDIAGPMLNPLNIAPPKNLKKDDKIFKEFPPEDFIPVSELKFLSTKEVDCKEEIALDEDNPLSYAIGRRKGCTPKEVDPVLKEKPDKVFYLAYDLLAKDNPHFHDKDLYSYEDSIGHNKLRTPQINNITLLPPTSPLLSQPNEVDPTTICNEETLKDRDCGGEDFCECVYTLQVGLDETVEVFLIDEGFAYDVSHPFHLHGQNFRVVAMERHPKNASHTGPSRYEGNSITREQVMQMDQAGLIQKNLIDPPAKDNVIVPDAGFTVIRFHADNPGYWLFHCHMSWHNHLGMALVFKVGEPSKDVGPPPKGFPTCGDFV